MTTPPPSPLWTDAQHRAIHHPGGDLLVSAAAGSGKTAVLAERCARLVCEESSEACGVENLLVLTFTDAAANEMRERIAHAIRARLTDGTKRSPDRTRWLRRQAAMVERAAISTLHAFCARVLRQHFAEAHIDPAFELMDEEEARLLREDALDDLLARWHALDGPPARAFADFFEAYAQGSDGTCRDLILRLHHMLASTADPAAYIAQSRRMYAPEGIPETLERYIRESVGEKLRLLLLTAERAGAEVRSRVGPGPMDEGLTAALDMLTWAHGELQTRGGEALAGLRDALSYKWPRLDTLDDVHDFKSIKDRTWEKVKDGMKSCCKNELAIDVPQLSRDLATLGPSLETLLALVADFQQTYAAAKRARNRLDFSDLERFTLNLLATPDGAARAELRNRYCHVLVDEFQDINPLQEALLAAASSPDRFDGKGNLFVVGDVKQAIYGFRLAQPELFLQRERAARQHPAGTRHIALPHNFRSHPPLLAAMNALFEKLLTLAVAGVHYPDGHTLEAPPTPSIKNQQSTIKNPSLFTGTPVELHLIAMDTAPSDPSPEGASVNSQGRPAGAPAPIQKAEGKAPTGRSIPSPTERPENSPNDPDDVGPENLSATEEEAQMVARRIRSLMTESRAITLKDGATRPLAYRDIAILLRTMKNKAMIFTRALAHAGIPVHADLSTGYFDTTEVRDTLALLHVMDNPQQDIPLATVLLGPYGRFSHDDLATIRLAFDRKAVPFAEAARRYPLFGETLRPGVGDAAHELLPFNADLAQRLQKLFATIERWRGFLRTRPLHEGLAALYAESNIRPYVAGLDAGTQRVANLQALHQRALKFSAFSKQGLHRFLRFIEKLRDQDGDTGEAPVLSEASDVVRILSVHKSKGLEFPVVIVAGLGAPAGRPEGGAVVLHRTWGIGLQMVDVERNVSYPSAASAAIAAAAKRAARAEELRLLYVAITRAREHLLLTGHLAKEQTLDKIRDAWKLHPPAQGLPEDTLMAGRLPLDWILPALASGRLQIQWPDHPPASPPLSPEILIHIHPAQGAASPITEPTVNELQQALAAGAPLPETFVIADDDAQVARMIDRVTARYPHDSLATEPAVRTVSQLKKIDAEEAAPVLVRGIGAAVGGGGEEALQRGVATHRLLELLDFSDCEDDLAIAGQIESLVARGIMTAEEVEAADRAGIVWFLRRTEAGRGVREAARRQMAGEKGLHLRRELPFTWVAPLPGEHPSPDPADWPTIRGTLDLLRADMSASAAEIIDYKTDSPATWQQNLPAYERQVSYYLRAASEILGFPVKKATIAFLAAHEIREVSLDLNAEVYVPQADGSSDTTTPQ